MKVKIVEYGTSDSHYKSKEWPKGRVVTVYPDTLRDVGEGFIKFQGPEGHFAEVKVEDVIQ